MALAHPVPARHQRSALPRIRELALSAAWNAGLTRALTDVDGRTIDVVYPGTWSHGYGPDFRGAMLALPEGGMVNGSIELHLDGRDWYTHGHHRDARYDDVILHVVSQPAAEPTVTSSGRVVPVAVLTVPDETLFGIDARLPAIWDDLGGDVCAGEMAAERPERLRRALDRLGDERLQERVVRIEGELACAPADVVLIRLICDALGWSENRAPMAAIADSLVRIGWAACLRDAAATDRIVTAQALLLGCSGFLPLSPAEAHLAGLEPQPAREIEQAWAEFASRADILPVAATAWQRARTRPANHPVARLALGGTVLAALAGDPVGHVIDAVSGEPDMASWLRAIAGERMGQSYARAITGSVLIPFALAVAHAREDLALEERASAGWETLRRSDLSRPAKRALHQVAGAPGIRSLGERAVQGLLRLDRVYCSPRRCYECPIAAEVARDRLIPRN